MDLNVTHSVALVLFYLVLCLREGLSCCAPSQVQGISTVDGIDIDQNLQVYSGHATFFYDEMSQKLLKNLTIIKNTAITSAMYLYDYPAGKKYAYTATKCDITELTESFEKVCVTSTAKFISRLTFGLRDNALTVNRFRDRFLHNGYDTTFDLLVTSGIDKCLLIGFYKIGRVPDTTVVGTTETSLFWNLKKEITNPSVFDLPSVCTEK